MIQQGKPFLVARSSQHELQEAEVAKVQVQLTKGDLYADLIVDRSLEPPVHHWIIQRKGSAEIMFWDMSFDGEGAEERVRWHLDYFSRAAKASPPAKTKRTA